MFEQDLTNILQNSTNRRELMSALAAADTAYRGGQPLVSDTVYDTGFTRALQKWPKDAFFKRSGGAAPISKVELPCYLGSLDKVYPEDVAPALMKRMSAVSYEGGSFGVCVMPKLDGIAGLAWYGDDGKLQGLATQGNDGRNGENLLAKFGTIEDVQPVCYAGAIVRGEFIIPRENEALLRKLEPDMKGDRRSCCAGLLRRGQRTQALGLVHFVAFQLMDKWSCHLLVSEQLDWLHTNKWNTVASRWLPIKEEQVTSGEFAVGLSDIYSGWVPDAPNNPLVPADTKHYATDGIVVCTEARVGFGGYSWNNPAPMLTEGNPDYAFAYKQKRDGVETTVTGVELTIGRTGKVCGVIHIDPVQVDGITATKATIKSADFILTGYCNPPRPINVGSRVLVERSGVVIPNVASVVEGASEPAMPPFAIELRGADWYVTEKHVWQYAAELAAWFALTSDGLGESAATLLATDEQSTLLQVLSGKAVFPHQHQMDSYVNWLAAVKQMPLSRLMAAHGPFTGIGVVRAANLIAKVPALRRLLTVQECVDSGTDFRTVFEACSMPARLPVFMQEWDTFAETLKVAGGFTLPVERQGKQLVLSGTRDTDLIQRWTDLGGTYAESVTKKTDILVFAPEMATGTKVKKAQGYGIRTVGIDDFLTNVRWYYENQ